MKYIMFESESKLEINYKWRSLREFDITKSTQFRVKKKNQHSKNKKCFFLLQMLVPVFSVVLCCFVGRLESEGWICPEGRSRGSAWPEPSTLTGTSSSWTIRYLLSTPTWGNTSLKNALRRSSMENPSYWLHTSCRWGDRHNFYLSSRNRRWHLNAANNLFWIINEQSCE